MGLSARIFVGLAAGILTGLFFGEMVAGLKVFGDIFVKLLQITVLPYIIVSLIAGFGRMDLDQARRLAVRGTAVLLAIWAMALVIIFVGALAFPDRQSLPEKSSTISAAGRAGVAVAVRPIARRTIAEGRGKKPGFICGKKKGFIGCGRRNP